MEEKRSGMFAGIEWPFNAFRNGILLPFNCAGRCNAYFERFPVSPSHWKRPLL
jgi:hypothetical protein